MLLVLHTRKSAELTDRLSHFGKYLNFQISISVNFKIRVYKLTTYFMNLKVGEYEENISFIADVLMSFIYLLFDPKIFFLIEV